MVFRPLSLSLPPSSSSLFVVAVDDLYNVCLTVLVLSLSIRVHHIEEYMYISTYLMMLIVVRCRFATEVA